jgi:hypothetical protein
MNNFDEGELFVSCQLCLNPPMMTDNTGLNWCNIHQARGYLINLGKERGFPDLQCPPFALPEGEYFWTTIATVGKDELIAAALATLDARAA